MQISKIRNKLEQNKSGVGEYAVVEGLHGVKHALRFKAKPEIILVRDKVEISKLCDQLCPDLTKTILDLSEEVGEDFNRLTNSEISTGILGIFHKPRASSSVGEGWGEGSIVLLDNPKDLDNLGAVIRVCAAANIKTLVLTGELNPWNSRAIRSGAGLHFALNIQKITQSEIKELRTPVISFDERGEELDSKLKAELPRNAIYVFGSERDGISQELKEVSTKIVRLPMKEGVSSMNLATSVAAALYSLK